MLDVDERPTFVVHESLGAEASFHTRGGAHNVVLVGAVGATRVTAGLVYLVVVALQIYTHKHTDTHREAISLSVVFLYISLCAVGGGGGILIHIMTTRTAIKPRSL